MIANPVPTAAASADNPPFVSADVARGVTRMLLRHDLVAIAEVPVGAGRRVDLMAIDPHGAVVIIEIKVSRADLIGDGKWTDYLDHCDRYFWAVPHGFDTGILDSEAFLPDRAGLIVADKYDAAILREAKLHPLPPARRKKLALAFARRAGMRLIALTDPDAPRASL